MRTSFRPRTPTLLVLAFALGACGSDASATGAEILSVDLSADAPPEARTAAVETRRDTVTFPDGEAAVEIAVDHTRWGEGAYLRAVRVTAAEPDGYQLQAELLGIPSNAGSVEAPIEQRMVQITRSRTGWTGTELGQMSVRISPTAAERL